MSLAGDDPTPWNLLADGTIVGIERTGDVLAITVEVRAVRVRLHLAGCDAVSYQPHDEPVIYDLAAIAASEPDIARADVERGALIVGGGAGALRLAYANLSIELDGAITDLDELARCVRTGTSPRHVS